MRTGRPPKYNNPLMCTGCGLLKSADDFHPRQSGKGHSSRCQVCVSQQQHQYWLKNKERLAPRKRDAARKWARENRDKRNCYNRQYMPGWKERNPDKVEALYLKRLLKAQEARQEIINRLGRVCIKCGYSADLRALQIDHVNGDGKLDRARYFGSLQYYRAILTNLDSGRYQLLCANCNWIKRYDNGEIRMVIHKEV